MNDDLDVNILVQTFNEKISQLMTEVIVKDATIKQLNAKIKNLSLAAESNKPNKQDKNIKQSDDFQ
ncbi:MAG: hypothetical protein O3C54_03520 [Proteobacteria bacterium]|nr:hypothetical protein [Pseudomonadota bacterium]